MSIETREKAVLELRPNHVQQGSLVLVAGAGWPIDAIVLSIDKEIKRPVRVLRGTEWNGHFVPDVRGEFLVEIATGTIKPGTYSIRAETLQGGEGAEAGLIVDTRVRDPKAPRPTLDKPFIRGEFFKGQRTGDRPGWLRLDSEPGIPRARENRCRGGQGAASRFARIDEHVYSLVFQAQREETL